MTKRLLVYFFKEQWVRTLLSLIVIGLAVALSANLDNPWVPWSIVRSLPFIPIAVVAALYVAYWMVKSFNAGRRIIQQNRRMAITATLSIIAAIITVITMVYMVTALSTVPAHYVMLGILAVPIGMTMQFWVVACMKAIPPTAKAFVHHLEV